ncbi:hypothetical protein CDV31_002578 [Fusarium ambrosium]|uniref:Uncharacterized protein n=1 Tax=Fusarium ambrosium TaxID=131363 RepID=A0A428UWH4_9HYPO|nr:hypothetical protein CDV31_002578 [Fusarium ambrosium]
MAEILGATSSIITIWDVAKRAKKLYGKAKDAPDSWKRYSEELERLAHVQTVLASMIQNSPCLCSQMIQVEGKSQSLVSFVNERLETVRKEAANILDQYRGLKEKSSTSKKVMQLFTKYKFALAEQDIQDLIQAAEHAKSSLQSALCLMHLETLGSWQQQTRQDFQVIHDNMRRQAEALQMLENSKKLSQIPLPVSPPPNRQSPKRPVTDVRSLTKKLKLGSKSFKSTKTSARHQRSGSKTPSPTRTQPALPARRTGAGLENTREETQHITELEDPVDIYDAEDEGVEDEEVDEEPDDEPIDGGDSSSSESEMTDRDDGTQEREYDLICRNGMILSIGTDTEEYQSAFSDDETRDVTTTRLDDVLAAATDEEWTRCIESGPEELYAFLTSAPCTAACSDVESTDEESPIYMDLQQPTSAFIGETVHLRACLSRKSNSLFFCVWHISLTETCQTLAIQEPCQCSCQRSCQHATLEIMDTFSTSKMLPYTIPLESMSCYALPTAASETDSKSSFILKSFERCRGRKRCVHTIVEASSLPQPHASCILPVRIQAWLGDDAWESDTSTERAVSDAEDDAFPSEPGQGDDELAFALLQAIKRAQRCAESSDIPDQVQFNVLVGFLKLTEKYSLEEPYLTQGKEWTEALLPSIPTSLDRDAVAWLWVLWKLQMGPEFKKLSGIIQQQATHRIDQEPNEYGVEMPGHIVEAIEQRRISVLFQIRGSVTSLIEALRDRYGYFFREHQQEELWDLQLVVITSALTVWFLTLESGRFLSDDQQAGNPDFHGVCFVDATRALNFARVALLLFFFFFSPYDPSIQINMMRTACLI